MGSSPTGKCYFEGQCASHAIWNLEAVGVGYFLIIRILKLDLFAHPAILHFGITLWSTRPKLFVQVMLRLEKDVT